MSLRSISPFTLRSAQLAAQLSREPGASQFSTLDIARHATETVAAAEGARRAIEGGKSPAGYYRKAHGLVSQYHAEVVEAGDLLGVVLGLRFASGTYRAGFGDVLHVS